MNRAARWFGWPLAIVFISSFASVVLLLGCNAAEEDTAAAKSSPQQPNYGSLNEPNFSHNPPAPPEQDEKAKPSVDEDRPRTKGAGQKKSTRSGINKKYSQPNNPPNFPSIKSRPPSLDPPPNMIGDSDREKRSEPPADTAPANDDATASIFNNDVGTSSVEKETSRPVKVEVFYVTDRQSIEAIGNGDFLRTFKWPIAILIIATLMGVWAMTQRRILPGLVALLVLAGGVSIGYSSLIQWQRLLRLDRNDDIRYTSELKQVPPGEDPLDYGTCMVNIPPDHRVGYVDSPSLQRFEFREDTQKHVILERVIRAPRAEFFQDLNDRLESGNAQTLVFVHGYNVSFENAVKRTAQVSFDLKFDGVPVCYSWPSHGGLEDYTRDMANADWTVVHLQQFLTSLFDETKAKRIHLIAHSMGNRALMQALDRLALQWHREKQDAGAFAGGAEARGGNSIQDLLKRQALPRFGQIVMAAPDISADEFRQRYARTLRELADQITLYASSRDRALMVSTSVHGHNRAGLAGEDICVVDGVDTIDVSHVDTSLIGHSYYGDNPALINDLRALIQLSHPTSQRQWLEQVEIASDKVYWKFR